MQGRGKGFLYRPAGNESETESNTSKIFHDDTEIQFKRAKPLKRATSFISLFDPGTQSTAKIRQSRYLGSGTYTHAFECKWKNLSFTEKKPHLDQINYPSIEAMESKIASLQRETDLMVRANNNSASTVLFIWPTFPTPENAFMPVTLDFRLLTDFVAGNPIKNHVSGKLDIDFIPIIFYQAAIALNKLHEKGIVHGDVSPGNTLVKPDLSVEYIDFGLARLAGDLAQTFMMREKDVKLSYIAPECFNRDFTVAHTSQDIYSLAHTFQAVISFHYPLESILSLYTRYPCLESFITNGLSHNPEDRPLLPEVINELHDLLAVPLLKLWIKLFSKEAIDEFIKSHIHYYTDEQLTDLVYSLLQQQNHRAEFIINCLQQYKPEYRKDGLFDLFMVIAELNEQMKRIHSGVFHEPARKQIIRHLSVAFEFARDWMNNIDKPIKASLFQSIQEIPVLKSIYENIPLTDQSCSEDADEMSFKSEYSSCTFSPSPSM